MGRKEEIFKIINFACLVIFIVQALELVIQYRNPQFTTTSVEYRRLMEIEFPILFKVCVNPGFNSDKLSQYGYSDLVGYFHGKSSKGSSVIGWTGHPSNVSLTRKGDISRFGICLLKNVFKNSLEKYQLWRIRHYCLMKFTFVMGTKIRFLLTKIPWNSGTKSSLKV